MILNVRDPVFVTATTLVLGVVALESGLPAPQAPECRNMATVVQYVPLPEPSPLSLPINVALPPMTLSLSPSEAKDDAKGEKIKEVVEDDEPVRAHYRRRHRWRRR